MSLRPSSNPKNAFHEAYIEWEGEPPPSELEVYEEEVKTALSRNDSPDVGFEYSVNPYRGCYHGCAYCYARRSHQYWGFGAGTDFERKIIVKPNVPVLLRDELARPALRGKTIVFSGNTDCYQPIEGTYGLTRACLSACLEFGNPVAIITKGAVIRRDVELLAELARKTETSVAMSIAFRDDETGKRIEPWAPPISRRFETMRMLASAGIPTGIALAPVIPGLNDSDIPWLLEHAYEAGARRAFMTPLRLAGEVRLVFEERLAQAYPDRASKITHAIREMRGGKMNETAFRARMDGKGARWKMAQDLFEMHQRRLGMAWHETETPLRDAEKSAVSAQKKSRGSGSERKKRNDGHEQLSLFAIDPCGGG